MTAESLIHDVVKAILRHLETAGAGQPGVDQTLAALRQVSISVESATCREPKIPTLREALDAAISNVPRPQLGAVVHAIEAARHHLHWQVDHGLFYAASAPVGSGYRSGNMHCKLIAPEGGVFQADDLELGLFLLAPRVLYRDHNHLAPELYLSLTGPTGWRFGIGPWRDFPAGALIWNECQQIHATRVYGQPFLSVYAWVRDAHSLCQVVPADDWDEIERDLEAE